MLKKIKQLSSLTTLIDHSLEFMNLIISIHSHFYLNQIKLPGVVFVILIFYN